MKNYYFVLILLLSLGLQSQNQFELSYHLPQNVTYNQKIPTPESVLGFKVGEWHVTHDKLVEYMKTLATISDRISIENRGKTFEGRPMILLTVTSPENQKNIESIRLNHLKLTEPGSNDLSLESMPIVVCQGFSIHGNEPSGSNASLTSDSKELLDVFLGNSDKGRDELIIEATSRTALIKGDWVLIPPYNGPKIETQVNIELGNSGEFMLFNLKEDPSQQYNLATKKPDKLKSMITEFEQIRGKEYTSIEALELH